MTTERKTSIVPGLAIVGCLTTGVVGVVRCFRTETADPLYLMASALAFGILAYLSFRD